MTSKEAGGKSQDSTSPAWKRTLPSPAAAALRSAYQGRAAAGAHGVGGWLQSSRCARPAAGCSPGTEREEQGDRLRAAAAGGRGAGREGGQACLADHPLGQIHASDVASRPHRRSRQQGRRAGAAAHIQQPLPLLQRRHEEQALRQLQVESTALFIVPLRSRVKLAGDALLEVGGQGAGLRGWRGGGARGKRRQVAPPPPAFAREEPAGTLRGRARSQRRSHV
jgi:hypothetical protein